MQKLLLNDKIKVIVFYYKNMPRDIIEIDYDKDKLKDIKSKTIICDDLWTLIIPGSKEIEEIKENIISILSCSNLLEGEKIIEEEWRKHYLLRWEIVKHILSTVSKDLDKQERIKIIKDLIREILKIENKITIFIKDDKIAIIDTWLQIKE